MRTGRERLRAWMDRSKLNQRQTAELLGVSEVYISQILAEVRTPGLENAILIERVTGIPVESWSRSELSNTAGVVADGGRKRKVAQR